MGLAGLIWALWLIGVGLSFVFTVFMSIAAFAVPDEDWSLRLGSFFGAWVRFITGVITSAIGTFVVTWLIVNLFG